MRLNEFVGQQPARMEAEHNICGVLVHARPEFLPSVQAALAATPGVEIHHVEPDGRMIVTAEDADGRWAGAIVTSFQEIEGIMNFALVYHHTLGDQQESVQ